MHSLYFAVLSLAAAQSFTLSIAQGDSSYSGKQIGADSQGRWTVNGGSQVSVQYDDLAVGRYFLNNNKDEHFKLDTNTRVVSQSTDNTPFGLLTISSSNILSYVGYDDFYVCGDQGDIILWGLGSSDACPGAEAVKIYAYRTDGSSGSSSVSSGSASSSSPTASGSLSSSSSPSSAASSSSVSSADSSSTGVVSSVTSSTTAEPTSSTVYSPTLSEESSSESTTSESTTSENSSTSQGAITSESSSAESSAASTDDSQSSSASTTTTAVTGPNVVVTMSSVDIVYRTAGADASTSGSESSKSASSSRASSAAASGSASGSSSSTNGATTFTGGALVAALAALI